MASRRGDIAKARRTQDMWQAELGAAFDKFDYLVITTLRIYPPRIDEVETEVAATMVAKHRPGRPRRAPHCRPSYPGRHPSAGEPEGDWPPRVGRKPFGNGTAPGAGSSNPEVINGLAMAARAVPKVTTTAESQTVQLSGHNSRTRESAHHGRLRLLSPDDVAALAEASDERYPDDSLARRGARLGRCAHLAISPARQPARPSLAEPARSGLAGNSARSGLGGYRLRGNSAASSTAERSAI